MSVSSNNRRGFSATVTMRMNGGSYPLIQIISISERYYSDVGLGNYSKDDFTFSFSNPIQNINGGYDVEVTFSGPVGHPGEWKLVYTSNTQTGTQYVYDNITWEYAPNLYTSGTDTIYVSVGSSIDVPLYCNNFADIVGVINLDYNFSTNQNPSNSASVSINGSNVVITGQYEGTGAVTVKSKGGTYCYGYLILHESNTVTINFSVSKVTPSIDIKLETGSTSNYFTLEVGNTYRFWAVKPSDYGATQPQSWTLTGSGCSITISKDKQYCDIQVNSAGTAWLTFTINGNYKYNYASTSCTIKSQITIQNPSLSINGNTSITYNNTSTLTVSGVPSGSTITWSTSNSNIIAISSGTNSATVTLKAVTGTGSATITVSTSATTNYYAGSKSISISTKKASSSVSISASKTSIVFNETITLTASNGVGTHSWSINNSNMRLNSTSGKSITATGGGIGTTVITVRTAGDSNYSGASATVTITISKANNYIVAYLNYSQSSNQTFYVGQTVPATYTLSVTAPVTWSSSNISNAYVEGGNLQCLTASSGTVITATAAALTYYNAASSRITVNVIKYNNQVSITDGKSSWYYKQGTFTLGASNVKGTKSWTSNNTSAATINSSGLVTPNANQTTEYTVTFTLTDTGNGAYHGSSTYIDITFYPPTQLYLTLSAAGTSVTSGDVIQTVNHAVTWSPAATENIKNITTVLRAGSATGSTVSKTVNTTSSNTGVASINGTQLTIVAPGTTQLKATTDSNYMYWGSTAYINLTVNKATPRLEAYYGSNYVSSITKTYLDAGFQLKPVIYYNNTNRGTIGWYTSNSNVISIDSNGNATIKNAGTCTVYAYMSSNDYWNYGKTQNVTITVNKYTPVISLTGFNVTYTYEGANSDVKWSINVPGVTTSFKLNTTTYASSINTTSSTARSGSVWVYFKKATTSGSTDTFYASFAGNSNYNATSKTTTVRMNKGTPKIVGSNVSITYSTATSTSSITGSTKDVNNTNISPLTVNLTHTTNYISSISPNSKSGGTITGTIYYKKCGGSDTITVSTPGNDFWVANSGTYTCTTTKGSLKCVGADTTLVYTHGKTHTITYTLLDVNSGASVLTSNYIAKSYSARSSNNMTLNTSTGVITFKQAGSDTMRVSYSSEFYNSGYDDFVITLQKGTVGSMSITPTNYAPLTSIGSTTFTATVTSTGIDHSQYTVWSSSDTSIADFQQTTNDTGKTQVLTIKKRGKVTITATYTSNLWNTKSVSTTFTAYEPVSLGKTVVTGSGFNQSATNVINKTVYISGNSKTLKIPYYDSVGKGSGTAYDASHISITYNNIAATYSFSSTNKEMTISLNATAMNGQTLKIVTNNFRTSDYYEYSWLDQNEHDTTKTTTTSIVIKNAGTNTGVGYIANERYLYNTYGKFGANNICPTFSQITSGNRNINVKIPGSTNYVSNQLVVRGDIYQEVY